MNFKQLALCALVVVLAAGFLQAVSNTQCQAYIVQCRQKQPAAQCKAQAAMIYGKMTAIMAQWGNED